MTAIGSALRELKAAPASQRLADPLPPRSHATALLTFAPLRQRQRRRLLVAVPFAAASIAAVTSVILLRSGGTDRADGVGPSAAAVAVDTSVVRSAPSTEAETTSTTSTPSTVAPTTVAPTTVTVPALEERLELFFDPSEWVWREDQQVLLDAFSERLIGLPPGTRVRITGFATSEGSSAADTALATLRAAGVANFFRNRLGSALEPDALETFAQVGESTPLDSDTAERVTIEIEPAGR